jgi:S-adenosylhomocysteine hydrolase
VFAGRSKKRYGTTVARGNWLKLESMSIKFDKLTPEQEEYLAGWSAGT